MEMKPIAKIENDYETKFAVPRQSGLVGSVKSKIVFEKEYSNPAAFEGLEGFSHIWLIWEFDRNAHSANSLTVRPPRLGGNKKVGVFASRAPYRPNPIGLSSVKLERIEKDEKGNVFLIVSGADLVNGTKIYDIKPYLKISDCHPEAVSGFSDEKIDYKLTVKIPENLLKCIKKDMIPALIQILEEDPRPAYHHDESRIYGFRFSGMEIKFRVKGTELSVTDIENE